jgi:hypothetical protein
MNKNHKPTSLDYTNSITSSHNEEAKALNIVAVNSLVPVRYGKVDLTYYTTGFGTGNIKDAKYYSNGAYQETRISTRGDLLGSAHKTILAFLNRTPASLAGKAFVVHDDVGAVKVWFNVDFSNTEPDVVGTYRSIQVSLLSTHTSETIANRTAQAMDIDANFLAAHSSYYVIISSSSSGIKPSSYDFNTSLYIKNTEGADSQTLNNKYFFINSALNENQYYVWYNVGGAGIDPAISGKTGLMVNITSGSSASTVAQNTKSVLDLTSEFITNIDNDTLIVTNNSIGITSSALDVNSGFLIFVQKFGESRELLVTLIITYNAQGNIESVERI